MNLLRVCIFLCGFTHVALSQNQSFASWVEELRQEALLLGFSEQTLLVLNDLDAPLERVLELDNSQPEFVQTFSRYLSLRVTPNQIRQGIDLMREHRLLLDEVRRMYGVQPHYLVAFWAIESNYGRNTGGFSVLQALATLAFDPRRAQFFRQQLLMALQIIEDGHIQAEDMSGSWAGAMGQLQFMPNIFSRYGVDGALVRVDLERSDLGATMSRMEHVINNLSNITKNTQEARSRIQDADIALETTNLTKAQVLNQAAQAMLAQANRTSQSILSLLQG